jgi:hypothetical protein
MEGKNAAVAGVDGLLFASACPVEIVPRCLPGQDDLPHPDAESRLIVRAGLFVGFREGFDDRLQGIGDSCGKKMTPFVRSPRDYQEGTGRHGEPQQRSEAVILRLASQGASLFPRQQRVFRR